MNSLIKKTSLITVVLLISFMAVQTAEAKVRVRSSIRTPHIGIRVNTRPVVQRHLVVRRVPLPVRRHAHFEITKEDRKMAKRLARYTGVTKRELIRLRRQGYRWMEIGRWLELPRSTVRAARDAHSWKHFLRYEQRNAYGHRDRNRRYDEPSVCFHH